jgi:hypothetical protein
MNQLVTRFYKSVYYQEERDQIIKILSQNLQLSGDVDLSRLAGETDGFCGADIQVSKIKYLCVLIITYVCTGTSSNRSAHCFRRVH